MSVAPFGTQQYRRYDLPVINLVNMYAERSPASRAGDVLLPRPALSSYTTVGNGPIRGIYQQDGALDGVLFVVSGSGLYAGSTLLGLIPGSGKVSMTASATQLLIASGTGLYLTDGATLTTVTFPDSAGVTTVAYINGYFLATRTDTQRFYWSAILDGSSWDALDFASAERTPDDLVAVWIVSDQLWLFGKVSTEIWVTTGDLDIPFQRVDGRLFDVGCINKDTIAKLDNTILWEGNDFKVYRGDSVPMRVSNFSVEESTQASSTTSAWTYPWQGNLFYALATSRGTQVLNIASGEWHEQASYDRTNWRANVGVFTNGIVLAGDDEDGQIWELVDDEYSDNGVTIERRWTMMIDEATFVDNVMLDASTGREPALGVEPLVECRMSRDGGETYGGYRQASIGQRGDFRKRIVWKRWGMVDDEGAVFDFRITDATPWRVSSIRVNEPLGGRGRRSNG